MLRIVNLEELHAQLRAIPRLVDALERKEAGAVDGVRRWLAEVERALESNRMPLAGRIAGLRATLDSAANGVIPAGVGFRGQPSRRKVREATAREMLKRAADLVSAGIQDDGTRVAEAERVTRQLIAVALFKGLIPERPGTGAHMQRVQAVWAAMRADPQIEQGAVHLLGLVGPYDALILLDRGMTRDVWRQ